MKRNPYRIGLFLLFLLTSGPLSSQTSAGYWRTAGTGDCPGRDVASSSTSTPDAARCDAAFKGYTAVCWESACTYKNVAVAACTGGAHPGRMYVCEVAGPSGANALHAGLKTSPQVVHPGETATTSAVVSGGTPPYWYEWFDGSRKSTVSTASVVWAKASEGAHDIRVVVTDAAGSSAEAHDAFVVQAVAPGGIAPAAQAASNLLTASISPAQADVESGGKVDLWAKVSGGVPPYSYEWRNGESLSKVTSASITYSNLNRLGGRDIRLTVKDSAGNSTDAHASFMVHPAGEIVSSNRPPANAAPSPVSPSNPPAVASPAAPPSRPQASAPVSAAVSTKSGQKPLEASIEDSRRAGNGSLQKISAIRIADECSAKVSGAPWGDDAKGASGTVRLETYRASVAHALRNLRVVYGKLTSAQAAGLDKMWAPFYDNPTPAAADWFSHLNPLLDEYIATAAALEENFPAFQESMSDVLVALGEKSRTLYQVSAPAAAEQYQALDAARKRLTQLASSIAALGDAPNPLAAKCAAQAHHRKVMGSEQDIVAMVKDSDFLWGNLYIQHRFGNGGVWEMNPEFRREDWLKESFPGGEVELHPEESRRYKVEWGWQGNVFTLIQQREDADSSFDSPCSHKGYGSKDVVSANLSQDGKILERFSFKRIENRCDFKTNTIIGPKLADGFDLVNVPLVSVDTSHGGTSIVYGASGASAARYVANISGGGDYKTAGDELRIRFSSGRKIITAEESQRATLELREVFAALANIVQQVGGSSGQQPPQPAPSTAVNAPKTPGPDTGIDPKEAIAQHEALAKQYQDNADRWTAEAANERDPARKRELEKRAADTAANANAERELAAGLRGASGSKISAADEAQAQAEAIADHEALAKQYQENAARWSADAGNEKDPARRQELQKRALEIGANASAERDIAASLRTGEIVRTRTEWDDQQQQSLVSKIHDELAQFDEVHRKQVEQLRAQKAEEMRNLLAQQKQAEQELATTETELSAAETVQKGASMAMTIGALAVPGAGEVAMAYSVGTGYIEGGAPKAAETMVRMYSPYMDAAFSAYEGWQQIDPATGKSGGTLGALKGAAWNVVTNQAMSAIGERLQGAVARISTDAATTGSVVKPPADIEAFHTTESRFEQARQSARTPEELANVNKQFETIVKRQEMEQKLNEALSEADAMAAAARKPDGSVDTARPEYTDAVKHLNEATQKINAEYSVQENRDLLHDEALEAAGLTPNDIILSGGKPKNALSDMDVTANTFAAGKSYTEALSARGLKVQEFGDRWVVSNDTTVWKPAAADAIGSSSYEAQVIHGASQGSDKFATQAGQDFTKGQEAGDQLGPVIDNFKKAGEAGLGGEGPKDLHVIGKSADKALGVAKTGAAPGLRNKLSALRDHQLPEQAGVLTLGASKEFKAKEMDSFLGSTEQAMGDAYKSASKSSNAYEADLVAQKQAALQAGDTKTASAIQRQLAIVRTDNRLAFATISDYAPELMSTLPPPGSLPPTNAIKGWTPLLQQLNTDRQDEGKVTVQFTASDPAFKGLGDRCKAAAASVDEKLKAAKPGSDDAKYLTDLKSVLQQGVANPGLAVQQTRQLTGYELPELLKQLGVQAAK